MIIRNIWLHEILFENEIDFLIDYTFQIYNFNKKGN